MIKITFEIAKKRFEKQGRKNIYICEENYISWTKKAMFYDMIIQDYFWAVPKSVYNQKSCHPRRKYEKQKKTFLKKYGVKNPSQINFVKEKKKQASQKKYGTNNVLQSLEIKNKIKKTNLKKYGKEYPTQSQTVLNKTKITVRKKYGVDNISQTNSTKEKIKKTNLKNYGKEYVSQTKQSKEKVSNRFIIESGEHLSEWLKTKQKPKPGYSSLCMLFENKPIKEKDLEQIIQNYKDNKTSLEVLGEEIFNTKHYNRKPKQITKAYKPDFKLTDKVYVNVDGLYWHSEINKDRRHHFDARKEFEDNNLRLIQFYDDEIKHKTEICKSIVSNAIGKTQNKIFARKCTVKVVPHKEAKTFLGQNHLMGSTMAKHVGLYFENNLISLLSYKEKKHVCKIERFCSLVNYNIVGGFSKLLKHLERLLNPSTTEIHNWVDLRYGTGKHLLNKGFVKNKETLGWKWTDGKISYNRLKCRANMDDRKLTQQQYAAELGWFKIYDAGQGLYVKYVFNKTI